jgi:hypothetical protein
MKPSCGDETATLGYQIETFSFVSLTSWHLDIDYNELNELRFEVFGLAPLGFLFFFILQSQHVVALCRKNYSP